MFDFQSLTSMGYIKNKTVSAFLSSEQSVDRCNAAVKAGGGNTCGLEWLLEDLGVED